VAKGHATDGVAFAPNQAQVIIDRPVALHLVVGIGQRWRGPEEGEQVGDLAVRQRQKSGGNL
jgi:hypothetical protein